MRFTSLTRMADNLMIYKNVVKNVARKHGMTATFMPKPLFEDNASGMHVHQSIWNGSTNLFHGARFGPAVRDKRISSLLKGVARHSLRARLLAATRHYDHAHWLFRIATVLDRS